MASFTFESASSVAVGTFNIHILTPDWLVKCGVLEDDGFEVQFALTKPGLRIRYNKQSVTWTINPDRLEISSKEPAYDCGAVLAQILERLPETPMFAVGANIIFSSPFDETLVENFCPPPRWGVAGHEVDSCMNVLRFVDPPDRSRAISLDLSRSILRATGNAECRGQEASSLAATARRFTTDLSDLRQLLKDAWNIEILSEIKK